MSLELRFDLERKELVISFPTVKQAQAYQSKNPESRIYFDDSRRDVWLPMLPSMKYIRASSVGLAICFKSAELARSWCKRSIIGTQHVNILETEVLIHRKWEEGNLDRLLRSNEGVTDRLLNRLLDPTDGIHTSRGGARSGSPGIARGADDYDRRT